MITPTPETAIILSEMETPVTLSREEIAQQRASFDLPDANHETDIASLTYPSEDSEEDTEELFDEENSESEIPGDPREPHQLQPPTREAY